MSDDFDVLIKNGLIVDGTGAPGYKGTIAIKGERITALGDISGDSVEVVDADGCIVSPGFIDVHNHGDLSILYYPKAEGFVRQGITTFVGGQCGSSPGPYGEYIGAPWFYWDIYDEVAPYMYYSKWVIPREDFNVKHKEIYDWELDWNTIGEFFKKLENKGFSPNYVPLVGHGDVRSLVMGPDFKRKATQDEIAELKKHIEQAMLDGCRGMSVGRDYDPGIYADFNELVNCAKVVAKYEGVYASHSLRTGHRKARKPGDLGQPKTIGVLEAIDIGRKAKLSVQISHLGALYDVLPGDSELMKEASVKATLKLIDDAREEGLDINFDVIPNCETGGIVTSPLLASRLAPWIKTAGGLKQFSKALSMKDYREDIKNILNSGKYYYFNPNLMKGWAKNTKIESCINKEYNSKTVAEIAESSDIDELEALMEILHQDPETTATGNYSDPYILLQFYKHPEMMIGIDTFALDDKWQIKHPPYYLPNQNSYGGFPRYIRKAVRESKALSIEEAIRKITSLPARKFKLEDRGILKKGAIADITVFNPETVRDVGDQLKPRRYPEGIEYVLINGRLTVKDSEHTGAISGKILYRK